MENHLFFLKEAVKEAKKALKFGEVPIGAVIVKNNRIIGRGFNKKEFLQSPTAHAEIIAIEDAAKRLNSWRLTGTILYSTVEPCIMCCGAIIQARIEKVVYSTPDPKFGGVESLFSIFSNGNLNHKVKVEKYPLEEPEKLLKEFFRNLRKKQV
ncbi:nucleoside deaminase [Desulfurobacterium atlanticum]|uniref:tRNA-specific adenosine deaminase n=1 Tax=Desulfurobacterium atlanticum TaxID=240169 RepID=A0A238ZE17_9BACT|nr:nucleoside deaminase [Desulfurobacterium atlanticum]SNR81530.1 tRNA(adenine34) deaminase [Desulfurobacterium atlanticum]